jgi:hypothetical protein
MNKDIRNTNDKNQYHGYQEIYNWTNVIFLRANYKNNRIIGYFEYHMFEQTTFYIR